MPPAFLVGHIAWGDTDFKEVRLEPRLWRRWYEMLVRHGDERFSQEAICAALGQVPDAAFDAALAAYIDGRAGRPPVPPGMTP